MAADNEFNIDALNELVDTQKVDRTVADAGLVANGSVVFSAGDNLTTEKKTSSITLAEETVHPDDVYMLAIDKPTEDTAGNLTVYAYNEIKADGTNSRDVLHSTLTVEKVAGVATYRSFLLQGLFIGEGKIKLGMKFATDSGAITVYYKLYRL